MPGGRLAAAAPPHDGQGACGVAGLDEGAQRLGDYREPSFFAIPTPLADTVAGVRRAVVLLLVLAAASGLVRATRRRVYALIAAGTAGFAALQLRLPFPFGMSTFHALPRPIQAALPAAGPALVLGAGLLPIRSDRRPDRISET